MCAADTEKKTSAKQKGDSGSRKARLLSRVSLFQVSKDFSLPNFGLVGLKKARVVD